MKHRGLLLNVYSHQAFVAVAGGGRAKGSHELEPSQGLPANRVRIGDAVPRCHIGVIEPAPVRTVGGMWTTFITILRWSV